jgi:hypothetical protein
VSKNRRHQRDFVISVVYDTPSGPRLVGRDELFPLSLPIAGRLFLMAVVAIGLMLGSRFPEHDACEGRPITGRFC